MGDMSKKNAWICESEKTLLTSPVMSIIEQKCRSSENERRLTFYLMRSRDWCNIVPITEEGKVVMVRQHRIGIAAETTEIPGGVMDPGDPDAQAAALREMQEETGYVALPGAKVTSLGWVHPNPAILDNRCHLFVVGPVRRAQAQKLDPGEMIETHEVPIAELPSLIRDGKFTHSLMLNAFLFALLRSPEGSALLARQLETLGRT
jgi:8-oxo-dGTP pyrophosphatase MutT (NUDIX family)